MTEPSYCRQTIVWLIPRTVHIASLRLEAVPFWIKRSEPGNTQLELEHGDRRKGTSSPAGQSLTML